MKSNTRPFLVYYCFILGLCIQTTCHGSHSTHTTNSPSLCESFLNIFIYKFHTVSPGKCYRSAQLHHSVLEKYIKKYGIKTVINLRGKSKKKWWLQENAVCQKCNVKYINIPMSGHTIPSKENLISLLDTFQKAPQPILIHCKAGRDRTGEAAAIWLMDQKNISKQKARKQLSFYKFLHSSYLYPAKDFFIKIWQGREWALHEYNPSNYPNYYND